MGPVCDETSFCPELEGEKIGFLHDEAEADGFADEVFQGGFGFPGDRVIDAIANDG